MKKDTKNRRIIFNPFILLILILAILTFILVFQNRRTPTPSYSESTNNRNDALLQTPPISEIP